MTNIPLPPPNKNTAPRRRPYTPPAAPVANHQPRQAGLASRMTPPPAPGARRLPSRPQPRDRANMRQWLKIGAGFVGVMTLVLVIFAVGVALIGPANLIYGSGIASGVRAGGVPVGRLSEENAAEHIASAWANVALAAAPTEERGIAPVSLTAAELGLSIDANASADRAFAEGRTAGSLSSVFASYVDVPLTMQINTDAARAALTAHTNELNLAPVNAGVALVNSRVQPTDAQNGLAVDIEATLAQWQSDPIDSFENGTAYLVMNPVAASITDSSALVAQAEAMLTRSLDLRVYDPVTDDSAYWSVPPEQWGNWLTATSDPNSAIGLSLQLNDTDLREYLTNQAATALDPSRTIDVDQGVAAIQAALAAGTPDQGAIILKHLPRTHVVQAGETMMTIGYNYGIPYLYIAEVNPGVETLSVGQTINLPPADEFLLLPVVPNKRIVVSISNQTVKVYENGALKWDWKGSTGIASSPTWPGVYQILLHEKNAFASIWDLWMPNFLGVYSPVPTSDFTNGFHGMPTRSGGQILWENSIGSRVTYGCILLSNTNMQLLYDWAEDGVVVEIQA